MMCIKDIRADVIVNLAEGHKTHNTETSRVDDQTGPLSVSCHTHYLLGYGAKLPVALLIPGASILGFLRVATTQILGVGGRGIARGP